MARAVLQQPAGLSRQRERQGIRDIATTFGVHSADTSGQPLAPATRMFLKHVSVSILVACEFFRLPCGA